ncbi:hypothetical protein ACH4VR_29770 [Streptomyces sp. NPDC020883]|uniref:hypothetical protein n=1 Tax=Streptomyces sp. NPDC020883 TaxID=3365099 RepID=UPI0037B1963F
MGDRHPKAEVEAALQKAEHAGLKVKKDPNGHRWGRLICCPCAAETKVWGTPKCPGTEAKKILEFVRKHAKCV